MDRLGPQGRLHDPFFCSSSSHHRLPRLRVGSSQLDEVCSTFSGDYTTEKQGSHRGGPINTGFLQPDVCGTEKNRRFQTDYRPVYLKHLCDEDEVQDGDNKIGHGGRQTRGLDGVGRLTGCLSAGAYAPGQPTLSPLQMGRPILAIPHPLLRPLHGTSSLHSAYGTDLSSNAQARIQAAEIFRRLAHPGNLEGRDITSSGVPVTPMPEPGYPSELGEVFSSTGPGEGISGDGDSVASFEGFPDPGTTTQSGAEPSLVPVTTVSPSEGLAKTSGPDVFSHLLGPQLQETDEKSSNPSRAVVEKIFRARRNAGPAFGRHSSGPTLVVRRGELEQRAIPPDGSSGTQPPFRCLFSRLGCLSPTPDGQRSLVPAGGDTAHQPAGAESNKASSHAFCSGSKRKGSGTFYRQHDSPGILSKSGRRSLSISQQRSTAHIELGGNTRSHPSTSVHPRDQQRPGGCTEQKRPSPLHRVDPQLGGVSPALETVGLPDNRLVCYKGQLQTGQLCLPIRGSSSHSNGCIVVWLEPSGPLCVPSFSTHTKSLEQVEGESEYKADSNSTILATEGVVSRPMVDVSTNTETPAIQVGSPPTTSRKEIPPTSPRATSNRMETIDRLLRHKGFSAKIGRFLARHKRHSTTMNYQCKWNRYRLWCKANGHSVSRATVQKIAEFLVHLREDLKLSTTTIKGYKAMLNGVFSLKGLDLNNDRVIKEIIKTCSANPRKAPRDLTPPWNLDVVLKFLTGKPFEPISHSSLRDLTRKTLFLVALASAKRVGELHALSFKWALQRGDVILSYLPEFIAKTDTETFQCPREACIKSLSALVGSGDEERLLCPVRAIKEYSRRTEGPNRPRSLFVSVKNPSRRMSKSAMSYFLKEVIKASHTSVPDSSLSLMRVKAHDVRGVATSMLMWKNCTVPSILRAASWRTRSVFANHYLSEITRESEDVFSLGPIVAAGQVVDTSS